MLSHQIVLTVVSFLFYAVAFADSVSNVTIRTRAENNRNASVWYRVPENYREISGRKWRVLVIFGGRNCSGSNEVSNALGWAKWADRNGVFLVAPGFRDDRYWEPQAWSGRALLSALEQIGRSYKINTKNLLYYGYSAGSQASNLFAAWRPDLCRAWVSHACGVFHEPSIRMRRTPGLVTCGDADAARDILSREFIAKAKRVGQQVIWKSYPNHPHDVPHGSIVLARAFLEHYDAINRDDLQGGGSGKGVFVSGMQFIGDDPDGTYWSVGSPSAQSISLEDRVHLPSRLLADAWGKPGKTSSVKDATSVAKDAKAGAWSFFVDGVEFICRIPSAYSEESRIAILFGGRNWTGEKTLRTFGFNGMADTNRLFLVSPSFSTGEYWRPETGSGLTLKRALDSVRRRFALKNRPVILYGYSAGGQCAALFSEFMKDEVAAWGVHGCGVFPLRDETLSTPVLVTCGEDDSVRFGISRQFAYRRRDAGGFVLWRGFANGHELNQDAIKLADAWLSAFAGETPSVRSWGEDDTQRILPVSRIEREFRNPLYTQAIERIWRQ